VLSFYPELVESSLILRNSRVPIDFMLKLLYLYELDTYGVGLHLNIEWLLPQFHYYHGCLNLALSQEEQRNTFGVYEPYNWNQR